MAANPNRISLRNLTPAQLREAEENSIKMQRAIEESFRMNVNPNAQQQNQEELMAEVAARLASLKSAKEYANKNQKEEEDLAKALRESAAAAKAADEAAKAIQAAQEAAKAIKAAEEAAKATKAVVSAGAAASKATQQDPELLRIIKESEDSAKAEEIARAAKAKEAAQQEFELLKALEESAKEANVNIADVGKASSKLDLESLRALKEKEEIAYGIIPVQDARQIMDPKVIEERADVISNNNKHVNSDEENLDALTALALMDKTAAAPNSVSANVGNAHDRSGPFCDSKYRSDKPLEQSTQDYPATSPAQEYQQPVAGSMGAMRQPNIAKPSVIHHNPVPKQPTPVSGTGLHNPLGQKQASTPAPAASPAPAAAPVTALTQTPNPSAGAASHADSKKALEKQNAPLLNKYILSQEQWKEKQAQMELQRREQLRKDMLTARKDAKDRKAQEDAARAATQANRKKKTVLRNGVVIWE